MNRGKLWHSPILVAALVAAAAQILAAVTDHDADALVIGYHRGGPPGSLEAGSTARSLAHMAPCAVLSIPL